MYKKFYSLISCPWCSYCVCFNGKQGAEIMHTMNENINWPAAGYVFIIESRNISQEPCKGHQHALHT